MASSFREFLKGLDFDKETIDTVMAEHGKYITESKEEVYNLKAQVAELTRDGNSTELLKELNALKKSVAERDEKEKADKEEKEMLKKINDAIGDKKFVNDYTKNSIINEIKTSLKDEANAGKTAKDLFETITKDKTDVFKNENQFQDMPGVGNDTSDKSTKSDGIKLNPMFKSYN